MLRSPDPEVASLGRMSYDERLQEELKLKMSADASIRHSPFHPQVSGGRVLEHLSLPPLHPLTYLYGGLGPLASAAWTAEHLKSQGLTLPVSTASAFSIDSILSRPSPAPFQPRHTPYFPYPMHAAPHDLLGELACRFSVF